MNQRMQADVSTRMAALHNHISSVSSTHNLAADSAKDDHVTSPACHVTSIEASEDERKKKGVYILFKVPSNQQKSFSCYIRLWQPCPQVHSQLFSM